MVVGGERGGGISRHNEGLVSRVSSRNDTYLPPVPPPNKKKNKKEREQQGERQKKQKECEAKHYKSTTLFLSMLLHVASSMQNFCRV